MGLAEERRLAYEARQRKKRDAILADANLVAGESSADYVIGTVLTIAGAGLLGGGTVVMATQAFDDVSIPGGAGILMGGTVCFIVGVVFWVSGGNLSDKADKHRDRAKRIRLHQSLIMPMVTPHTLGLAATGRF